MTELKRNHSDLTPTEFDHKFKGCDIKKKNLGVKSSNHGTGVLEIEKRTYSDDEVQYFVKLRPETYPQDRWECCSGWFDSAEDAVQCARDELGVVLVIDDKSKKPNHATACAITCGEQAFHKFISVIHKTDIADKDQAAEFVREKCGVKSRKDLNTNTEAGKIWISLRKEYQTWLRE